MHKIVEVFNYFTVLIHHEIKSTEKNSACTVEYIIAYLNTLCQMKQFPIQISEFVHISEEVINH